MEGKIELEFLTYDKLKSILEKQSTYHISKGKQGKLADLSASIIEDFNFSKIDLSDIFAIGSVFIRCKFTECEFYTANLSESKFIAADFRGANLHKTEFYRVEAKDACFDSANCSGAEFDEANLTGATFRNANLGGASFVDCDLTNAIFDGARLTRLSTGGSNKWDNTSFLNIEGENPVPGA